MKLARKKKAQLRFIPCCQAVADKVKALSNSLDAYRHLSGLFVCPFLSHFAHVLAGYFAEKSLNHEEPDEILFIALLRRSIDVMVIHRRAAHILWGLRGLLRTDFIYCVGRWRREIVMTSKRWWNNLFYPYQSGLIYFIVLESHRYLANNLNACSCINLI